MALCTIWLLPINRIVYRLILSTFTERDFILDEPEL